MSFEKSSTFASVEAEIKWFFIAIRICSFSDFFRVCFVLRSIRYCDWKSFGKTWRWCERCFFWSWRLGLYRKGWLVRMRNVQTFQKNSLSFEWFIFIMHFYFREQKNKAPILCETYGRRQMNLELYALQQWKQWAFSFHCYYNRW